MTQIPRHPKIYHITHIDNLDRILTEGVLWSDAKRLEHNIDCEIVGMTKIKQRRLEELEVICHINTMVGEYVPFYFCPRSIMLFLLHRENHADITYKGGQEHILHLQADLIQTINWADDNHIRWAFSDMNAGARYAMFYNHPDDLNRINWSAIESNDFRSMQIKDGKQAEFLIYESFPFGLVEHIGVNNQRIKRQVEEIIENTSIPQVSVKSNWYY